MTQIIIDGITTSAIVAGAEYTRLQSFWVESARHQPLTRGGITLPDPDGAEIQRIQKGDAVTLVTGYRGDAPNLWQATVSWTKPGSTPNQTELGLVGADKAFAINKITQAFVQETPEAILRHALAQAGIPAGRIDATGVTLPRFMASNETIWQLAEKLELTVNRSFAVNMSPWALWMDATGTAHWGDFDDPNQSTIFAAITGENLLNHSPATDAASLGKVETFLLPSLLHSQQMRLQDMYRNVSGLFRVQKVRHEGNGTSARSHIWYGPERQRY